MGVDSTLLKYEMIARRRHCSSSRKHHHREEKGKERKGRLDATELYDHDSIMVQVDGWIETILMTT